MHTSTISYKCWQNSQINFLCNSVFIYSLPQSLQNLIKQVEKTTYQYCRNNVSTNYRDYGSNIEIDKCFLLSEFEVFGSQNLDTDKGYLGNGNFGNDGYKYYEYYDIKSNLLKYNSDKTFAEVWWLRTSAMESKVEAIFLCASSNGVVVINQNQTTIHGISPAFCI